MIKVEKQEMNNGITWWGNPYFGIEQNDCYNSSNFHYFLLLGFLLHFKLN